MVLFLLSLTVILSVLSAKFTQVEDPTTQSPTTTSTIYNRHIKSLSIFSYAFILTRILSVSYVIVEINHEGCWETENEKRSQEI